jgi:hydrogenase-4 component B
VDGLSALFLAPIYLIVPLGAVYGLRYWRAADHPTTARKLQLFYGLLPAGMATLVVARNGLLFLTGWEVMALSAFFLVSTEDHDREVRAAGWLYLVATHVSTLCLFALFALFAAASGSLSLDRLDPAAVEPGRATTLFVLALVGFGLKAGAMPLHVWLPSAHASAPSHVSAVMSGVLIKMGVYGVVRFTSYLPHHRPEWGAVVLAVGAASGVLGVAYAIGQHDLKRLLAYHSIENIGIIMIGIGLALLGRSAGRPDWMALGLAGALLHVWNHALFKALLFLGAGSVVHATHTREVDHLGGLARVMPRTAAWFLVGAVAICGLPPLNGFVSELLIYLGLFRTLAADGGPAQIGTAVAAPVLALIGALAVACFVKVYGAVFLGSPRTGAGRHAAESGRAMTGPMAVLGGCCAGIGVAPALVAPALGRGVSAWAPEVGDAAALLRQLVPFGWVTGMGLALVAGLAVGAAVLWVRVRRGGRAAGPTWGCGYAAPTPRMQYTASSFAQMLVRLFAWALLPRTHRPGPLPLFPGRAEFHSGVPDAVLDRAVLPGAGVGAGALSWARVVQSGSVQAYVAYIFVTLLVLLLWR